jgi:arsenate reductase-like glutaredoxin family protein
LEASDVTVKESVPASRKLGADEASEMLANASKLVAMKGKKIEIFAAGDLPSEEAVAAMLGPTGNMRAPTIRKGKTLLVGFNEEVFEELVG